MLIHVEKLGSQLEPDQTLDGATGDEPKPLHWCSIISSNLA